MHVHAADVGTLTAPTSTREIWRSKTQWDRWLCFGSSETLPSFGRNLNTEREERGQAEEGAVQKLVCAAKPGTASTATAAELLHCTLTFGAPPRFNFHVFIITWDDC